jgi:uncharacterized tellurite resistance protein B-like protein
MFDKFSSREKRYVLELINSIAQIDGSFTGEESCILASVAYLMEIDLDIWSPNLVDISLAYSRVCEMGKNKIKEIIVLLMQVSIFDGLVKYEELALILPLAYEVGLTDKEMIDLGRRAFTGEKLTPFDKLLVYALCIKMMEVDSEISIYEKRQLKKIQEKFNLPDHYIDRQLVNNIQWALNIIASYSLNKRYHIIEYIVKIKNSDGQISEEEITLLFEILRQLGLKEYEQFVDEKITDESYIVSQFNKLKEQNEKSWKIWNDFVKQVFYEEYNQELDSILIEAVQMIFKCGLNIDVDKYEYLEAKRILAHLYYESNQYKELKKILKEVYQLEVIPKWYWGLVSRLDFKQLSHGIQIKNDRLLKTIKEYTKYGDESEVDLISRYPVFINKFKNFMIQKNTDPLDFHKISVILGLEDMSDDKINQTLKVKSKYTGHILILGGHKGRLKDRLFEIAHELGFDGEIELGPDYDEIKSIGIEKYKNSNKYDCVFLGECPHSLKGREKLSMKSIFNSEEYPPLIELRTKSNRLYLTDASFRSGLIMAISSRYFKKID